jgi:hypothetical protein
MFEPTKQKQSSAETGAAPDALDSDDRADREPGPDTRRRSTGCSRGI